MATPRRSITAAQLAEAQSRFVTAWGQMGTTWGISRTMAEIHALLYITGAPLNTDEVMERLSISRGNASMSLRALVEWGIVTRVHKRGDRKEYYEAESDVWSMCRKLIRERLRREIHPVLASLFEVRDLTTGSTDDSLADHHRRLDELLELVQTIDLIGERFVSSSNDRLRTAASLLSKLT